jgi:hypothetical protein
MKKIYFLLVCFSYSNLYSQTEPNLETTTNWLMTKFKTYTQKVGDPHFPSVFTSVEIVKQNREDALKFSLKEDATGKFYDFIFLKHLTSFKIYSDGILLAGQKIKGYFMDWNNESLTDKWDYTDAVVIWMNMDAEENLTDRMTKALNTFISLKKKKADPNEAF